MNSTDLLRELEGLGICLAITDAGRLRVDAPKGVLTASLRETLSVEKERLLSLLSAERQQQEATINAETARVELMRLLKPNSPNTAIFPSDRETRIHALKRLADQAQVTLIFEHVDLKNLTTQREKYTPHPQDHLFYHDESASPMHK